MLVYIFGVWLISPVSTMLIVLVDLVCILKYKLNKSYLCLTHGQFLSSLIQPLGTSDRIMCVVKCLHYEIRMI